MRRYTNICGGFSKNSMGFSNGKQPVGEREGEREREIYIYI